MGFLVAALGALAAVYFWMNRARNVAHMADEVADMASSVLGAARRWNFRRSHDKHPVDCIEEQHIATGALAVAFLELGGTPTREDKGRMNVALRAKLRISAEDADEVAVLGHWLVGQCGTAAAAVTRLGRQLRKLAGERGLMQISEVIDHMTDGGRLAMVPAQVDALAELGRIFKP